jgi:uncharacterized Zn finger protein
MPSKAASLRSLITAKRLRRLAGDVWFDRGETYHSDGRVKSLRCDDGTIAAVVTGTRVYRVKLWIDSGELAYSCTCPLGGDDAFCKHCVATGLAWLAGADRTLSASSKASGDIRSYLSGLTVGELVDMIMARANEDEGLYRHLVLRAAKSRPKHGGPDIKIWKQAFENAVGSDRFVSYEEAGGYAAGIDEVIDSVEELLKDGHAEAVIALAEYGLEAIEGAIENIDDSDGEMGGLLERLQELHLAACRKVPPEPEALARRLFEWELLGQWNVFHGAVSTYADILGERGLAVYRRLAETEWKKVPALTPGDSDADRYGKRFNITRIMEALATQSGDLEGLVEIKSRDLSMPYCFLEIASLYKEAGYDDKALNWAERGWRAFAGTRADDRLREFLADAYHDRGRHKEAVALIWESFLSRPDIDSYKSLHRHAKRCDEWPVWRDKALAYVRERISAAARGRPVQRPGNRIWAMSWSDRSILVEILLWERKAEDAWHEAKEGGCSAGLWLRLAEKREKAHPLDALAIYCAHVPKLLEQTDNRAYQEAMTFLRRLRVLFASAKQVKAFEPYLAELRVINRRKRNFIKLLDQEGW